jgi:ABC-type polysaccharide/polyol phosphate transport system ATPase subunit
MLPNGTINALHVWKRFRVDKQRWLLRDFIGTLGPRPRSERSRSKWRWALQDVTLQVAPGESVGVVGVNGSGKSTFLKILTRVMYPYAGRVELHGRVAALIEIKAGIHPDLTGRENIYIYGSLIGLRRSEVARRFDAIVEFAELSDAIDRQIKFFSSGMQMRLAFSVAAFLEPDILLVDEVLAVGDAAFQQKCLDRMKSLLVGGTTLVFVSHDLAAVEAICSRGVWLHSGVAQATGPVGDVLTAYRTCIEGISESTRRVDGVVQLLNPGVVSTNGSDIRTQHAVELSVMLESFDPRSVGLCFGISEGPPRAPIMVLRRDLHLREGQTRVGCVIDHLPLPRGRYYLWAAVLESTGRELLPWQPVVHFDVVGPRLDKPPRGIVRLAPIHVEAAWRTDEG